MTDESLAVVYKIKMRWNDCFITKYFCSKCKMELTDPADHSKFRVQRAHQGGWNVQLCPFCKVRLKGVETPLFSIEQDQSSTSTIEQFTSG